MPAPLPPPSQLIAMPMPAPVAPPAMMPVAPVAPAAPQQTNGQEMQLPPSIQPPQGQLPQVQPAAYQAAQVRSSFRDNDLHVPGDQALRGITAFVFGSPGTWKTTWAGQWPKPVFLSVGQEGGDDALVQLPSIYGVPIPRVYTITSYEAMHQKVNQIVSHYREMDINTVVVDSITYYVDLWIAQLMEKRYNDPKIKAKIEQQGGEATNMTMRDWGILAMHIRDIAMALHKTPLNVIWTALEKEVKQNDEAQGTSRVVAVEPYIKGEMAIKLPGMCKMIVHAHKEMKPDPHAVGRMFTQPVYYTSPNFMTKLVRHKYGNAFTEGRLIDPQCGDLPTFRAIWDRIGRFVYRTE